MENHDEQVFFEEALSKWEQIASDFVSALKENVETLSNVELKYEKVRVRVYNNELDGKKKRCGQGPAYYFAVGINQKDAENIWALFEKFVAKYKLPCAERWSNNEEIGMYNFNSNDTKTDDSISCSIWLPNEWNGAGRIILRVFVGSRFSRKSVKSALSACHCLEP